MAENNGVTVNPSSFLLFSPRRLPPPALWRRRAPSLPSPAMAAAAVRDASAGAWPAVLSPLSSLRLLPLSPSGSENQRACWRGRRAGAAAGPLAGVRVHRGVGAPPSSGSAAVPCPRVAPTGGSGSSSPASRASAGTFPASPRLRR
jgi:hypothetical protein